MTRARTIPAKICIIGAGIAGLTAAIKIFEQAQERGFEAHPHITILEAENRAGGRVRTDVLSNGLTVDTGGHWLHNGTKNALYQWAAKRYKLGPISIDDAKRRINASNLGALPPSQREWAMTRLFELYATWKAHHPDDDISLADLAAQTQSPIIRMVAEERAINWMAVDAAKLVSSDEFFGDESGSGGVQLKLGMGHLIAQMVDEVEYYGGTIKLRTPVKDVRQKSGGGVVITDMKDNVHQADLAIVTAPIGVLQGGSIKFSKDIQSKLQAVLAGLINAKMTKIFVPLRKEFFVKRKIVPDTFITFYDQKHSWLCHVRTDGNPVVTIFACGAMSDLVETAHRGDIEDQMFELLEAIPLLKGCSKELDGRMMITDWITSENFLGAYSAALPGYHRIGPLDCGSVLFAGEAFVADAAKSPSQMLGAWHSGNQVATKILRKLKSGPSTSK